MECGDSSPLSFRAVQSAAVQADNKSRSAATQSGDKLPHSIYALPGRNHRRHRLRAGRRGTGHRAAKWPEPARLLGKLFPARSADAADWADAADGRAGRALAFGLHLARAVRAISLAGPAELYWPAGGGNPYDRLTADAGGDCADGLRGGARRRSRASSRSAPSSPGGLI